MISKTKLYKIYSILIKTTIIVLAFWFIYQRLFFKDNIDDTIRTFESQFNKTSFLFPLVIVLLFMLLNWGIEMFKWNYMIKKIETVSIPKSIIAVLSGLTVSIFTPNRVGEYAGRVFVLEKADRWEGALITMLGSMTQLLVTILAGSVAFILFSYYIVDFSISQEYYFNALMLIIIVFIFILLLLFYNVSFLSTIINRLPERFQKIKTYGIVFTFYRKPELSLILMLCMLRYTIFITQFYILLLVFGVNIPFIHAFMLISLIYLVMAAIPTIALTELGVRGSVALYFFGLYFDYMHLSGDFDLGIITASSMLWVINLALPALVGAIFIGKLKFFRK